MTSESSELAKEYRGLFHWLMRQLFCRRGQHRAGLDWSPEHAFVFCFDCPSFIKNGATTNTWRKWASPEPRRVLAECGSAILEVLLLGFVLLASTFWVMMAFAPSPH
jgi:hypothetical protein